MCETEATFTSQRTQGANIHRTQTPPQFIKHHTLQNHVLATMAGRNVLSYLGRDVQNGGSLHVWPNAALQHVGANRFGLPLTRGHRHQPTKHLARAVTHHDEDMDESQELQPTSSAIHRQQQGCAFDRHGLTTRKNQPTILTNNFTATTEDNEAASSFSQPQTRLFRLSSDISLSS